MRLTGRWVLRRFYVVVILDIALWINVVILNKRGQLNEEAIRCSTPQACVGKVIYIITHGDGFRGQLFGGFGVEGLLGWTVRLVMLVIWNGGA